MVYDFLIVGAGLYGSVCAYELSKKGYKCLIIDERSHLGGNCYTEIRNGIPIHMYGPHIFHTSNKRVWDWINQFAVFNNYIYSPVADYNGERYSLPFNLWTFQQILGLTDPSQVKQFLNQARSKYPNPQNLEEAAIASVGIEVYERLIKGYTSKQWMKDCTELPSSIIRRLPVRLTYNSNYFDDLYQGIPKGGYTPIFEKLLANVDIQLNTDFFTTHLPKYNKLIYTGAIDRFYQYRYGQLEYKTQTFKHKKFDVDNYQGAAVINYTSKDVPYTRVIEHKHFDPSITGNHTWVTEEYPTLYVPGSTVPMYPVNDFENQSKFNKYRALADKERSVIFGGRLAEYKYYDMHIVIEQALSLVDHLTNN